MIGEDTKVYVTPMKKKIKKKKNSERKSFTTVILAKT